MKILDLSQTISHLMPVYPGDPPVMLEQVHKKKTHGWNLMQLTLSTHTGTHVNAPAHMSEGVTIDQLPLSCFMGRAIVFSPQKAWGKKLGLIFVEHNLTMALADKLIASPPAFVGCSEKVEISVAIEKKLLEHNIVVYENLANCEKLPAHEFEFYGLPLLIKAGDGSPVRAVATWE